MAVSFNLGRFAESNFPPPICDVSETTMETPRHKFFPIMAQTTVDTRSSRQMYVWVVTKVQHSSVHRRLSESKLDQKLVTGSIMFGAPCI